MDELSAEEKRVYRQLTLAQIRALPAECELVVRLAVEQVILPKSASRIETWYAGPSKIILTLKQRRGRDALIQAISASHDVGQVWGSFTEFETYRSRWTKWAAPASSREDGTLFIDCGVVQLMQLFRRDGQGRSFAEIEVCSWYDAALRRGYISQERFLARVPEILREAGLLPAG